MRYGVCDTSPTHKNRTGDIYAFWDGWRWRRRTTPEHVRAGLPGWVSPSVVEAKLSAAPTATVKRIAAEYRIAGRLIDASIVEDQAFAFGLLPREEMAAIYAARNALELTKDRSSVTRPSARGAS